MFQLAMYRPTKFPVIFALVSTCLLFVLVALAQTESAKQPEIKATTDTIEALVKYAGYVSLGLAIIYGAIKKTKYDNLKTTNEELTAVSNSRKERINDLISEKESLQSNFSEKERLYLLQIKEKETTIEIKDKDAELDLVTNRLIVRQSLQMKAILRQLREQGKWDGDEDAFF